jgi:murein L,D-transpeptidase YafK
MKQLARIFSALVLLALIAAAAAVIFLRPLPPPPILPPLIGQIDRIVIEKAARRMVLYQGPTAVREYRIALGFSPIGDKSRQGDGRTPEGSFRINRKNESSAYHLSLGLDYPQADDRAKAIAAGFDPGGDIMIHGQPNSLPATTIIPQDWTAGCIALSNAQIAEVFATTTLGTEVQIKP